MTLLRVVFLVLISILVLSCTDLVVGDGVGSAAIGEFEYAWLITKNTYPYFAYKAVDWDSIRLVYEPLARRARGDEIVSVLFAMLTELKDGHVSIGMIGGENRSTYEPPRSVKDRFAFDPLIVRRYCDEEFRVVGESRIEYAFFRGSIGYVRLTTFERSDWIDAFPGVLDAVRSTRGLIIDVRHNGGGSTTMSEAVVRRFIASPLARSPVYIKGVRQPTSFVQPEGPYRYERPVVVLMNGVCFSATEHFLDMMNQIPTVTTVGDTSGGGSGAPEQFILPSGREISIPTKDLRRYDDVPYEWVGVPPKVWVGQSESDARSGRDLQLEHALQLLK